MKNNKIRCSFHEINHDMNRDITHILLLLKRVINNALYHDIPTKTPKIVREDTKTEDDGTVKTKTVVGKIDNTAYPAAYPLIQMTEKTPSKAGGAMAMFVDASGGSFGGGRRGGPPPAGAPGAANTTAATAPTAVTATALNSPVPPPLAQLRPLRHPDLAAVLAALRLRRSHSQRARATRHLTRVRSNRTTPPASRRASSA